MTNRELRDLLGQCHSVLLEGRIQPYVPQGLIRGIAKALVSPSEPALRLQLAENTTTPPKTFADQVLQLAHKWGQSSGACSATWDIETGELFVNYDQQAVLGFALEIIGLCAVTPAKTETPRDVMMREKKQYWSRPENERRGKR